MRLPGTWQGHSSQNDNEDSYVASKSTSGYGPGVPRRMESRDSNDISTAKFTALLSEQPHWMRSPRPAAAEQTIVAHARPGVSFSPKEGNPATCRNMDDTTLSDMNHTKEGTRPRSPRGARLMQTGSGAGGRGGRRPY